MIKNTPFRDTDALQRLAVQIRRWILRCTARAGSGHPTSGLSATELMTALFFGGILRYDPQHPDHAVNDRVIFSKGHASPLLYALWAAAGQLRPEQLESYREFGSELEGHPTSRFALAEAATGSLGQGLSIGLGMALNAKRLDDLPYRTFVLLGDSEMAEGSQWEALQLAAHYELDNLIGIMDVNRLGQRGETMYGHDLQAYRRRVEAFGWEVLQIEDGHDFSQVLAAYDRALESHNGRPKMLIATTVKGKGIPFLEDENGWHGKALDEEKLAEAMAHLPEPEGEIRGEILVPENVQLPKYQASESEDVSYEVGSELATRDAYGNAITRLAPRFPRLIALDGEVCNSTRSKTFRERFPDRFFEMYIAEQNMVGTATGLALRGKTPFVSTFGAFLTRAFDQIRMSRYSDVDIKFVGSHCGVSVGQDGPSQMALEDIAMFRTVPDSVVVYPCDAVATERLVEELLHHHGIGYLRTTRGDTPVIYSADEHFPIGGCKLLRSSDHDQATILAAGITLHEALEAHARLTEQGVSVRVIDLYSVKPIDAHALLQAAEETGMVVVVEDHFPEGGLGEAVASVLAGHAAKFRHLAVRRRPLSGSPEQLLDDQGIAAKSIVEVVRKALPAQA